MRRLLFSTTVAAMSALVAACDGEPQLPDGTPTWYQDVQPLLAEHCLQCHTRDNIGTFSLATYGEVRALATWIGNTVRAGEMPPWRAEPGDQCAPALPFRHDPRLGEADWQMLQAWARADAPEGDPSTAPSLPDPISRALPDPDAHLVPDQPFSVLTDEQNYRCALLDPGHDADRWITSAQVTPDSLSLIHGIYLYVVPPERVAEYEARVESNGSFDCFSTMAWEGLDLAFVWLPDTPPLELPEDSGIRLPAGAKLLMQMHTHGWRDGGEDRSSVDLRWEEAAPRRQARFVVLGDGMPGAALDQPPLFVAAENGNHREVVRQSLPEGDWRLFAAGGRMNYAGVSFSARGPGGCLLHIPEYELDWMRLYQLDATFDELPRFGAGDAVELECIYSNSTGNAYLRGKLEELGLDAPPDMAAGPDKLDETCSAVVGVVQDVP